MEVLVASCSLAGVKVVGGKGYCIHAPRSAAAAVAVVQGRVQLAEVSSQKTANASVVLDYVTATETLSGSDEDYSCGSDFGF
jgi:hypothetical protein